MPRAKGTAEICEARIARLSPILNECGITSRAREQGARRSTQAAGLGGMVQPWRVTRLAATYSEFARPVFQGGEILAPRSSRLRLSESGIFASATARVEFS